MCTSVQISTKLKICTKKENLKKNLQKIAERTIVEKHVQTCTNVCKYAQMCTNMNQCIFV